MPTKLIGSLSFVLHAHLPYVLAHGNWPHGMDWLNEACAETYIPLLNVFNRLIEEGYSPQTTIGITPVLTEQLSDDDFKKEFVNYLEERIQAALNDQKQFQEWNNLHMYQLAQRWQDYYTQIITDFKDKYHFDPVGAFKKLQDEGHIEIITSAATHGYLPLLSQDSSIQLQIKTAIRSYEQHYGRKPRGFWLPECAYRPRYNWTPPLPGNKDSDSYLRKGVEEFLSENGIDFFMVDTHLLMGGKAIGVYVDRFEALQKLWGQFEKEYNPAPLDEEKSPYFIYLVSSSPSNKKPVALFTRDPRTGIQVWSGEHGYPGDSWYLDFHKKHYPGGLRYWRVTSAKSDLANKWEYEPDMIPVRLEENAEHFKELLKSILIEHQKKTGKQGIVCAPFDAELLGHWWFEGPEWLYRVLKWVNLDPELEVVTCSRYLEKCTPTTVVSLPEGSWGQGGFHWIWLNEWTEWTWRHIYEAEKEMHEIAKISHHKEDNNLNNILQQMMRELLLMESSDWQFLISTWSARDYAEMRITEHYHNFKRLASMADKYGKGETVDDGEWHFLGYCQKKNKLFPELKLEWFANLDYPPY